MKKSKINKKACLNCGLEAAVARKVCSGCNTPFQTKRPTYFYESKESATVIKPPLAPSTLQFSTPSTSKSEPVLSSSTSNEDNSRRRTERVKREKPHFYDASEFDSKPKKKKPEKNWSKNIPAKQSKVLVAQMKKNEKKRLKELKLKESLVEAEDEHIYEHIITPRKSEQLAIILEELNNKLVISAWKP